MRCDERQCAGDRFRRESDPTGSRDETVAELDAAIAVGWAEEAESTDGRTVGVTDEVQREDRVASGRFREATERAELIGERILRVPVAAAAAPPRVPNLLADQWSESRMGTLGAHGAGTALWRASELRSPRDAPVQ